MTTGGKAWGQLSGELMTAVDRDFERAALPLLRALWPHMVQPRGLAAYDKAGVDLVAIDEQDAIDCVVQCKGFFKLEGLADDQLGQITKSLTKFNRSGLTTRTFILLHNQDGRNKAIAEKIDVALAELIAAGVALTVHQWDRYAFMNAIREKLADMVAKRVSEQSELMLAQMDAQFRHGREYIPDVPVKHEVLTLRRGNAPLLREVRKKHRIERVVDALATTTGRWTLLLGLFGSGKTSAALHAARSSPSRILYVHAGSLGDTMHHGTHAIMARILDALAIFGDFEADERALFGRLASSLLRQLLSEKQSQAVLILDALDENPFLGSPAGVSHFASSLAELVCPVVLTTRTEHFRATLGNFDHLFDDLSVKGGNMDAIAVLSLDPWDWEQVKLLAAASAAEDPSNTWLAGLAEDVAAGRDTGWPEDLLMHPLFLRMIIDLAAEGVSPSTTHPELIQNWVWRKLTRDLRAPRALPFKIADSNAFLEKAERAMERIAAAMLVEIDGAQQLTETLPSEQVIEIVEEAIGISGLDLGRAISVSLLVPTEARFRGSVPIRFSHRVFQEYFLARHIVAAGASATNFPEAIKVLVDNMTNNGG